MIRPRLAEFVYYRLCCRGPLFLRTWMNKILRLVCPKTLCKCALHTVTAQPFIKHMVPEGGEWIAHSSAACAGWNPPWLVGQPL